MEAAVLERKIVQADPRPDPAQRARAAIPPQRAAPRQPDPARGGRGRDLAALGPRPQRRGRGDIRRALRFHGSRHHVGFHRLFAHKGYEATKPVRVVLAVAGSMAIEMGVIGWVATHRRHHAFSDQPGDPHSPHLQAEQGYKGILKGLWYAHMGWLFSDDRTSPERWAPDLLKDKPIRAIDRQFPFWVAVSFVLPAVARARDHAKLHRDAHRIRVGRARADLLAASRDVQHQLGVPLLRDAAVRHQGDAARTTGCSRSRRSASRGTTTTTRSRRARSSDGASGRLTSAGS